MRHPAKSLAVKARALCTTYAQVWHIQMEALCADLATGEPAAVAVAEPLDAAAALAAAAHGGEPGSGPGLTQAPAPALLGTAPWVVRYLWFLQPSDAGCGSVRATLRALSALRAAPALRPAHAAFGPVALCLRCGPLRRAFVASAVLDLRRWHLPLAARTPQPHGPTGAHGA